jgi:hypothetical protein
MLRLSETLNAGQILIDLAQVQLHDGMHSLLSASKSSIFGPFLADARMQLYQDSQLYRYTQEAVAETTAPMGTGSMTGLSFDQALEIGLKFPFNGNYQPMTLSGLAKQATGVVGAGAVIGAGLDLWGMSGTQTWDVGKYNKPK